MSRLLFWSAAAAIVYAYVGFPILVLARGLIRPRPIREASVEPTVSVVIAARNEEDAIGGKLDNLLGCDYPADRLQVVVASDGSTDATNAIVGGYGERVRLLALARVGKADALNAAVAEASGEILVFTDANSVFAPDALRALVRPFADPAVGGVAGDQRYLPDDGQRSAEGERRYWDYDRLLKEAESRAGSTVSATGAIYAIRRELFEPVRAGVTDDFITSTAVIAAGRRLVFSRAAAAFEPVAPAAGLEFERKVRIMTRGLRGVVHRRALLDPRRTGFYAIQLLSHKLLRRLVVVPLAIVAIVTPGLWTRHALYRLAALGQIGVYGIGAAGLVFRTRAWARSRPVALPAFFVLVNLAAAQAVLNVFLGRTIDRWEPRRQGAVDPPP